MKLIYILIPVYNKNIISNTKKVTIIIILIIIMPKDFSLESLLGCGYQWPLVSVGRWSGASDGGCTTWWPSIGHWWTLPPGPPPECRCSSPRGSGGHRGTDHRKAQAGRLTTRDCRTHAMAGHTRWLDTRDGWSIAMAGHTWWLDTRDGRTHAMAGHTRWLDTRDGWSIAMAGHTWWLDIRDDRTHAIAGHTRWLGHTRWPDTRDGHKRNYFIS